MRHSLHITNRCNLRCFYCYEDDKDTSSFIPYVATVPEALQRAENMIVHGAHSIEIIGGEPLLYPDIVQKVLETFSTRCSFCITTNGMINNEQIEHILMRFSPTVHVSVDDPVTTHRFRRGSDLNRILQHAHTWSMLTDVTIHNVLHPHNFQHMQESFVFYVRHHGFKTLGFGVVEEWMSPFYWKKYIEGGKEVIDMMTEKEMRSVHISPWAEYAPFDKEIIYSHGGKVELEEIFHPVDTDDSPYGLSKRELAGYYKERRNALLHTGG